MGVPPVRLQAPQVGDYRIIYTVRDDVITVVLVTVKQR